MQVVHPWCPTCRMEALELTSNGRHCRWCDPRFGPPFDAKRWPLIRDRLAVLARDRSAA